MSFHDPSIWALLLLPLIPLLWLRWRSSRHAAVAFSCVEPIQAIRTTWAVRWRWIIPALRTLALALLIIAIARPRKGDEQSRINTEGIAIQIIVDRSGSMRALDFKVDGREMDRLTVVKRVVREFVQGGKTLPGRPSDVIGLIAFASFADTVCPITTDHAHLIATIDRMQPASDREESATAIGDALALGVERLSALDRRLSPTSEQMIKGKVIILLTDGENNAGDIDPITAAHMATAFGIRMYTIGASSENAYAPMPDTDFFGRRLQLPVQIDEPMLMQMAEMTGGKYFRATDVDSLQRIYGEIDQLEKTKIHERRYVTYKEAAVQKVRFGQITLPPVILVVLVLLGLETLLANTRFRSIP